MHMLAILLQDNPQLNPEEIRHIVMAVMALIPIIIVITIAIVMVPCWFILQESGILAVALPPVPDTFTGHAGAAVRACVCRVEGSTGAGRLSATLSATAAAAVSTAGVRRLT